MNFLDKLERRFGRFAIPNIIRTILMGQAIVLFASFISGQSLSPYLWFDKSLILSGEFWRLFTFILVPDSTDVFMFMLFVLIYSSLGTSLEQMLGTFRMNVYYFTSIIAVIIVAFVFNLPGFVPLTMYINMSLFLAFASLVPDATFLLYFIIPFKAKYLLVFYFFLIGMDIFSGGFNFPTFIFILASLLGYIFIIAIPLLKGQHLKLRGTTGQRAFKQAQKQGSVPSAKRPMTEKKEPIKVAFHRCHVCGKTELDDPEMEFRYCSKCNGDFEYCMDHLKDHTHVE